MRARRSMLVRWWQVALAVVAIAFSRPATGRIASLDGVSLVGSVAAASAAGTSAAGEVAPKRAPRADVRTSSAPSCPGFAKVCAIGAALRSGVTTALLRAPAHAAGAVEDGAAEAEAARRATALLPPAGPHASQAHLRTSRILC